MRCYDYRFNQTIIDEYGIDIREDFVAVTLKFRQNYVSAFIHIWYNTLINKRNNDTKEYQLKSQQKNKQISGGKEI